MMNRNEMNNPIHCKFAEAVKAGLKKSIAEVDAVIKGLVNAE